MVDTIFADVAQPDQARIVAINAHNFLKNGGHFVISIKVHRRKETFACIIINTVYTVNGHHSLAYLNKIDKSFCFFVPR